MAEAALTYESFENKLAELPTKREYVDDFRLLMDKYRYKWQNYLSKSSSRNITDECDYGCAAQCFSGNQETTAAEMIFFSCLAPKCHCIRHMLSKRGMMKLQYEINNSTDEIKFLSEDLHK
jgi:hypothetical protein